MKQADMWFSYVTRENNTFLSYIRKPLVSTSHKAQLLCFVTGAAQPYGIIVIRRDIQARSLA